MQEIKFCSLHDLYKFAFKSIENIKLSTDSDTIIIAQDNSMSQIYKSVIQVEFHDDIYVDPTIISNFNSTQKYLFVDDYFQDMYCVLKIKGVDDAVFVRYEDCYAVQFLSDKLIDKINQWKAEARISE